MLGQVELYLAFQKAIHTTDSLGNLMVWIILFGMCRILICSSATTILNSELSYVDLYVAALRQASSTHSKG